MYIDIEYMYIRWYLHGEGYFDGYGKESIAQALSVGRRENQARPKSFASENRN
jgi:hypothetical protein